MDLQLQQLATTALAEILAAADPDTVESIRIKYLGRSGSISLLSEGMKSLGKEDKPRIGKLLNDTRNSVTTALDQRKLELAANADALKQIKIEP